MRQQCHVCSEPSPYADNPSTEGEYELEHSYTFSFVPVESKTHGCLTYMSFKEHHNFFFIIYFFYGTSYVPFLKVEILTKPGGEEYTLEKQPAKSSQGLNPYDLHPRPPRPSLKKIRICYSKRTSAGIVLSEYVYI